MKRELELELELVGQLKLSACKQAQDNANALHVTHEVAQHDDTTKKKMEKGCLWVFTWTLGYLWDFRKFGCPDDYCITDHWTTIVN